MKETPPISIEVINNWTLVKDNPNLEAAVIASIFAGNKIEGQYNPNLHRNPHAIQLTEAASREAEELAISEIRGFYPDAAFLTKKLFPNADVTNKNYWTINGMDGQENFSRGNRSWDTTIAYIENGCTKIGVVFEPLEKRIYYAVEEMGAYLNGKPIHVSSRPLTESVICFAPLLDVRKHKGEGESAAVEALWEGMRRISEKAKRFFLSIQCGGIELSEVTEGKAEGFASSWTRPYHLAAGVLLVREAGGIVTNIQGDLWQPSDWGVIGGNQEVYPVMFEILHEEFLKAQKSLTISKQT